MGILRVALLITLLASGGCSVTTEKRDRPTDYPVKIAFGSCVEPTRPSTAHIWNSIIEKKPTALLLLGDTMYKGHLKTFEEKSAAYQTIYQSEEFKSLARDTHVYAIWDDHDFGCNDCDSTFEHKDSSYAAFTAQWKNNPKPPKGLEKSIAYSLNFGRDVEVIMTDNRTYRMDPLNSSNPYVFGSRQLAWIRERLKNTDAKVIVLASGGQIIPKYTVGESMFKFAEERVRLLQAIAKSPAKVVIISGDRHQGDILTLEFNGKKIVEYTSSPLTAGVDPQDIDDPNRIGYFAGDRNFGMITISENAEVVGNIFNSHGQSVLSYP